MSFFFFAGVAPRDPQAHRAKDISFSCRREAEHLFLLAVAFFICLSYRLCPVPFIQIGVELCPVIIK